MAASWRVTVREGPRVKRERFADLDAALAAVERQGGRLQREAHRQPVKTLIGRDYDPVQQVAARIELSGRGARGGVDVRGDGSAEAFTGKVRRRLVEQQPWETPYEALRRTLGPGG